MSSIRKNFIYNSIYQILTIIIPLVTTPYLSRTLGASGIGAYSYAYSIANYFVIFIMLGLNNYGNRSIAKVRDDKCELSETFWSIYSLQLTLGVIVNILYFVYCLVFSKNLTVSIVMSLYVISASFDVNWFLFGMEEFRLTVIRNIVIKFLSVVLIFLFIKSEHDVVLYCLIMVSSILISQLVLWPYIIHNIKFYKPSINEIRQHIKPNLFLFLTVIAVSLFKIMDKIMLGSMTDVTQVGFYELAERIISVPTALITSLGTIMLPRMTNLISNNNEKGRRIIYYSVLFAMFISSSLCFGIMGVSKVFIPLFYGDGYDICILLYLILLPSCLFLSFANVIRTQYLLPHQMDKPYVISAFLGAIVNIVLNLLLIPFYGAVGAAIGTLFAEAIVCVYQSYKVKEYLPIKKYFTKSICFINSGIVMFIVLFSIQINIKSPFIELMVLIIIGIVLYFICLFSQIILYKKITHKSAFFNPNEI